MTTLEMDDVRALPRSEKLRMMEALWEDLSRSEAEQESPGWHRDVLKETKLRVASGCETVIDWRDAKQQLRARYE